MHIHNIGNKKKRKNVVSMEKKAIGPDGTVLNQIAFPQNFA